MIAWINIDILLINSKECCGRTTTRSLNDGRCFEARTSERHPSRTFCALILFTRECPDLNAENSLVARPIKELYHQHGRAGGYLGGYS